MKVTKCQLCNSPKLYRIIDLGHHPLADSFLSKEQSEMPLITYPLRVVMCETCGHAMLDYIVPPQDRYQKIDYSYTAGNSKVSISHFDEMSKVIGKEVELGKHDLAVDIGSNDGTLLKAFKKNFGMKILGIEPSRNIARIAKKNGVHTINDFFNKKTSEFIKKKGGAKIITATNVFNHITDMKAFIKDISRALRADGLFVFEVPYFLTLVEQRAFDTIYLEHISYFNVKPFSQFFKKHGMYIVSLERNEYMGGSIRVSVSKKKPKNENVVKEYIGMEMKSGVYSKSTFVDFVNKIQDFKNRLNLDLYKAKSEGYKVVAIGAATKGNTLLNYCNIDSSVIEFITDSSPLKIGKYAPGSGIQILPDSKIKKDITFALILPWNIADFLVSKLSHLKLKFIIPKMK